MTVTVLSVEQGNSSNWASSASVTSALLKSRFSKDPYKFVHVPVPDAGESDQGRIPAAVIAQAVLNTPGEKILIGNSTGNAYINKAVRDGLLDGVLALELTIWQLANPERKYGGWTRVPSPVQVPWDTKLDGKVGLPDDVPWQVVDFAQRYDLVADAATAKNPGWLYRMYAGAVGLALHCNYFTVSPDDPHVLRYQEGNITYLLHSPTIDAGFEQSYTRPAFV